MMIRKNCAVHSILISLFVFVFSVLYPMYDKFPRHRHFCFAENTGFKNRTERKFKVETEYHVFVSHKFTQKSIFGKVGHLTEKAKILVSQL